LGKHYLSLQGSKKAEQTHNLRAIGHNEAKYPEPDKFIPERFLPADGKFNNNTFSFAFGFG
jgi:cytochrome P450